MGTILLGIALIIFGCAGLIALGYSQGARRVVKQQNDTTEEAIAQLVIAIVKIEASYRDQRTMHKVYLVNITAALHALVADKDLRDTLLDYERKKQGVKNPFLEDTEPKLHLLKNDRLHLADVIQLNSVKRTIEHTLGKNNESKQRPLAPVIPISSPTPQVDTLAMPAANGYAETLHRVITIDDKEVP